MPRKERFNCKDCGAFLDELNTVWDSPIKKRPRCKECQSKFLIAQVRKRTYNLSQEEYDELVVMQLGGCAICKQPCKSGRNLAIDHNHVTGEVRGLLCTKCNSALGNLNEDEDLIWNMLEYLKRTTWKTNEVKVVPPEKQYYPTYMQEK